MSHKHFIEMSRYIIQMIVGLFLWRKFRKIRLITGNWKDNNKDYQHIQGVLLDVKHLMKIIVSQNEEEITNLSKIIEGEVEKWEKAF